jgi:hypothetical protein
MTNALITIAMLTALLLPIIIIGMADAKRHPWGKIKNNKPTDNPNVGPRNQRPEPAQFIHYD